MKPSTFQNLRRINVSFQCPESWDSMEGDERQRFCAGCGCHVHNIAEMPAEDAEELAKLSQDEKVCIRLTLHERLGIRTRDGWIPRLALAGMLAVTSAGCAQQQSETIIGSTTSAPVNSAPNQELATITHQPSSSPKTDPSVRVVTGTPANIDSYSNDTSFDWSKAPDHEGLQIQKTTKN
ncbi:MAG: hypothetical protein GC165_18170 [Armatimonadetes bacterium]|nr:hypothetical protein [Armatimonadota bacterium]